jgi:molybdenum cofactor cytidylyltransferase
MKDSASLGGETRQQTSSGPPVGIVILAAGASTRLGRPKQLLIYQERSLLRRAAESALDSVCQPVTVVLGAFAEQFSNEVCDLPVQIAINPQWQKGMSTSIRIGIEALEANPSSGRPMEAVVMMLCDQPFVTPQIIDELVAAYRATGWPIIASEYGGTLGVPALFSRKIFADLRALKEAEGAKKVIQNHADAVFRMPFARGAIDIDTPMDYAQLHTLTPGTRLEGL